MLLLLKFVSLNCWETLLIDNRWLLPSGGLSVCAGARSRRNTESSERKWAQVITITTTEWWCYLSYLVLSLFPPLLPVTPILTLPSIGHPSLMSRGRVKLPLQPLKVLFSLNFSHCLQLRLDRHSPSRAPRPCPRFVSQFYISKRFLSTSASSNDLYRSSEVLCDMLLLFIWLEIYLKTVIRLAEIVILIYISLRSLFNCSFNKGEYDRHSFPCSQNIINDFMSLTEYSFYQLYSDDDPVISEFFTNHSYWQDQVVISTY